MHSELTIDDIIEYIEHNIQPNDEHIEILPNEDTNNVDPVNILPPLLNMIFDSLKQTPCIQYVNIPMDVDISYISSILSIVDDSYILMNEDNKIEYIEFFLKKLQKESRGLFTKYEYQNYGWSIKDFCNNVKAFKANNKLIKYIADYLYINIFIVDIQNDKLIYIGSEIYNKYKKNIFIKLHNTTYEPVNDISGTISKIMKNPKLVSSINYINNEYINFIIGNENLTPLLSEQDDTIKNIDDLNSFTENNT